MLYLRTAGKKALADGGITDEVNKELNKTRCGIIIGSGLGGLRVNKSFFFSQISVTLCH